MGFLSFRWEGSNIPDKILFREHSTWQGIIYWRETGKRQAFRSFLEMVILMASALEKAARKGVSAKIDLLQLIIERKS